MLARWKVFAGLLLVALFLTPLVHAGTASIRGTVTDATGAVVADAKVTVVNRDTGASRTVQIDKGTGIFVVADLVSGVYDVTVEKQGFKAMKYERVSLSVDQALTLNPQIELSAVSETVTVTGESVAPIDVEDASISNLVDEKRIADLPLITRDPYQLILLGPGVIQSNTVLGGFSVDGTRERNNNFLFDGVDNNTGDTPGGPSGLNALNPDAAQEFRVITNNFSPEFGRNNGAIVDVVTKSGTNSLHGDGFFFGRYSALGARDFFNHVPDTPKNPYIRNDFGGSAGGPIIKDKTFWFANYEGQRFITTLTNTSIVPTRAFKSGKFTFQGTPIDVSTANAKNNALGLPLDPKIQKILALFPAPNGPAVDDSRGFLFFPSASRSYSDDFTIRMDHQLNHSNSLTGRYAFNRFTDPNPFHTDFLPGNLGAISDYVRTQNLSLALTSTIRPTVVNELRGGANRAHSNFLCTGTNTFDSFGLVDSTGRGPDYLFPGLGSPVTPGFGCLQLGDTNQQLRSEGTYQGIDTLTWVSGTHAFKFGGEYRDTYKNDFNAFNSRTTLGFSAFSNAGIAALQNVPAGLAANTQLQNLVGALLGFTNSQFQSQFFNSVGTRTPDDLRGFRQHETGLFWQDTWKARSNLTFTYGLRWEYYGVPYEAHSQFSNLFNNPAGAAPLTFSVVGPSVGGQLYRSELRDFEPRVGIAWDPFKTGKTSIRAGYGIYHDRAFGNLIGNARGNPPFQQDFNNSAVNASLETLVVPPTQKASVTVPNGAGIFPVLFDPNFHTPMSQNWNLGIQRQITSTLTVEVNYVGVKGERIFRNVFANAPQVALVNQLVAFCMPGNPKNKGFNTPSGQCDQSTLQFNNLWVGAELGVLPFDATTNNAIIQGATIKSTGLSTYHGLQLNVQKRLSQGFQIQGAYTYSHAIDDASDPLAPAAGGNNFPIDSNNLRHQRGNSDFDVRQRAVFNFIYQPNVGRGRGHLNEGWLGRAFEGWQMAGIVEFQSGLPYDVFGFLDTLHSGLPDRATVINKILLHPASGRDVTATGPQLGAFGDQVHPDQQFFGIPSNIDRNQFFGPGINNWNVVLSKDTALTERLHFQLRAEFYNLFNRVRFGQPDNLIADTNTFGHSSSQVGNPDGTTGARQIQFGGKLVF